MEAIDYLLDSDGDLLIESNDLKLGRSDSQHIQDLIYSDKGWWKESFNSGVGVRQYLGASGQQQKIQQSVRRELRNDGYTVNGVSVVISHDKTFIYPNATRN